MFISLRSLVPLTVLLLGLSLYGFISAQATPAPSNPPNSNTDAPINTGGEAQTKLGLFGADGITIATGSPTIKFHDTTSGSAKYWLHNNSNLLYILADRNGDGSTWDGSPYPLVILASTTVAGDYARFSGTVRTDDICDYAGANCFTPSDVVAVDTSGFITTGAAQTKTGAFTSNSIITGSHLYTAGNVRTANLCDAAGANCTAPSAILDTGASQTKTGNLTAPIFIGTTQMRSDSYCNGAGANCLTQANIVVAGDNYLAPVVEGTTRVETGNLCTTTGANCSTPTEINNVVNALSGTVKIQKGNAAVPMSDGAPAIGSFNVTFPTAFAGTPTITFTPRWMRYTGDEGTSWWLTSISTTGFTINWHTPGGGTTLGNAGVQWIAID